MVIRRNEVDLLARKAYNVGQRLLPLNIHEATEEDAVSIFGKPMVNESA
jgi:hypothetical protein